MSSDRRQKRISARRDEILNAAAHVFAEKGFERATTREIAAAADVAEGTLYNYFSSKEDILLEIMTRLTRSIKDDDQEGLPEENVRQFFDLMLRSRQEFVRQNFIMVKATLSEMLTHPELSRRYYQELLAPFTHQLQQYLEKHVQSGELKNINTRLATRVLMSTLLGMFVIYAIGDSDLQEDWDEVIEVTSNLFFDGLAAKENSAAGSRLA